MSRHIEPEDNDRRSEHHHHYSRKRESAFGSVFGGTLGCFAAITVIMLAGIVGWIFVCGGCAAVVVNQRQAKREADAARLAAEAPSEPAASAPSSSQKTHPSPKQEERRASDTRTSSEPNASPPNNPNPALPGPQPNDKQPSQAPEDKKPEPKKPEVKKPKPIEDGSSVEVTAKDPLAAIDKVTLIAMHAKERHSSNLVATAKKGDRGKVVYVSGDYVRVKFDDGNKWLRKIDLQVVD